MNIRIDTTLERDIDLLIIEEFISEKDFAKIFLDAANITAPYTLETAIHSKTDAEYGESDIVFILNINGTRHALHIEDKIDAIAMKNQSGRYHERAKKDIAANEYDSYSVLIVAPEQYLNVNKEAHKYPYKVKYEQLRDYFATKKDVRSKYKVALIERSIINQKNGYQWEANPVVVRFCAAMDQYQKEAYPHLPFGTQAWWRGYKTLLTNATIVYKANKGYCDLQFSNTSAQDLSLKISDILPEGMYIASANKSASI
ncbi:MAG: hypothetical protein IIX68_02665, partial [Clostridia bacterium]|nr:hypothetical protein [Clostridia bacterium]